MGLTDTQKIWLDDMFNRDVCTRENAAAMTKKHVALLSDVKIWQMGRDGKKKGPAGMQ